MKNLAPFGWQNWPKWKEFYVCRISNTLFKQSTEFTDFAEKNK